eukprot:jgi/Tetstr1/427849/TSEL_017927.t1
MNTGLSRPKDQIRWLLLEGISPSATDVLAASGYTNVQLLKTALDKEALKDALQGVHILGIRSRTQVDAEILEAAQTLVAVGCFSVGTNQVDLVSANRRGITVFNAPFSNTRSVAELTLAEIVMLMRGTFQKSMAAHNGRWLKSAAGSNEVRGKTLGIVGYGNIGSQLSMLAEAMGMRVIFFDQTDKLRHGNVEPTETLHALLEASDVVSLHLPQTPETRGMIGRAEIAAMKKGAYLINNARGTVLDIDALADALKSGHLAGAAVDVFPSEPKSNDEEFRSPLRGLDNVILTPHVQLPKGTNNTRFIQVQRNAPGELGKLNDLFAKWKVNIAAQHYQTDGEIGYVVLDADGPVEDAVTLLEEIRKLSGTIRARLLNRV